MEAAPDSSPSLVNCDSYILRLPNELLSLVFDKIKSQYSGGSKLYIHYPAVVCRRFRDILVQDLYRIVSLRQHSSQACSALITLFPSHAHHIRHLEASAPNIHPYTFDDAQVSCLLVSLVRCAEQFTQLRYLQLHLYKVDKALSPEQCQQADIVEMFKVLPPHLQELDLAGFSWTTGARALAVSRQPGLQRLLLNLQSLPGAEMAPAKLTANFPALLHIQIPARWCPESYWFTQAFEGSKLEHLAIGFNFRPGDPGVDLHPCSETGPSICPWVTGLRHLLVASSSSLTNLTISTTSFPTSSVVHHLEQVTTITFKDVDFDWDENLLNKLVGPLTTLSITGLHLIECYDIPQAFARWFEYTERPHQFFPALKKLEAGPMTTYGDAEDFYEFPEPMEGNLWHPEERRKLEDDCDKLGTSLVYMQFSIGLIWTEIPGRLFVYDPIFLC